MNDYCSETEDAGDEGVRVFNFATAGGAAGFSMTAVEHCLKTDLM